MEFQPIHSVVKHSETEPINVHEKEIQVTFQTQVTSLIDNFMITDDNRSRRGAQRWVVARVRVRQAENYSTYS